MTSLSDFTSLPPQEQRELLEEVARRANEEQRKLKSRLVETSLLMQDSMTTHLQDLENIVLVALNVAGQPEKEALEQMKIVSPMLEEVLKSYALWVIEKGKPSAFSSQPFADYESNMRKLIDEVCQP